MQVLIGDKDYGAADFTTELMAADFAAARPPRVNRREERAYDSTFIEGGTRLSALPAR